MPLSPISAASIGSASTSDPDPEMDTAIRTERDYVSFEVGAAVDSGNCGREQAASVQHFAHGREAEFSEQPSQTPFAALEVCVVAEAGEPAYLDPRLPGVDLPRMQVEREGLVARVVDLAQSVPREGIRQ